MPLGKSERTHTQVVVRSRRQGAIPVTAVMETTGRGVLDAPQAAILLLLLAILIHASPAFAEPCSRPTARSKIAETLKLASDKRPVNLTFRTHADGVKLSPSLKSKYPDDMTIILQNEFDQLNVKDDRFEVLMRFMGNPERLTIPFSAIKAFWDKAELKCSDG